MKIAGFFRPVFLVTILSTIFFLGPTCTVVAQTGGEEMMTLDQFKQQLRDEGKGRDLSQATHEELAKLRPGGPLSERVLKIGISTFILNLALIYSVAATSLFIILFFFTPLGLALFRGQLHAFIGALLKASGISRKFGEHLMKEPKRWLQKEKSVRQAFAMYMHNEFIQEYKNNITAIAFIGTAFLILNIGLRGVKFMVAHQPDMIVIAIIVEITVLCLLGMTTWYEKEEEEEAGQGAGFPGRQLSLKDVEAKLDALKAELESSVHAEAGLRQ